MKSAKPCSGKYVLYRDILVHFWYNASLLSFAAQIDGASHVQKRWYVLVGITELSFGLLQNFTCYTKNSLHVVI
jgi:hypothetical protein